MAPGRSCVGSGVLGPLGAVLLSLGLALGVIGAPAAAAPVSDRGPLVEIVELSGVIDQTLGEYLASIVERAETDGSELLVIQLDTPGGLGVAMDGMVETIRSSRVPIAVWVGPTGASALSAGMFIAYAAPIVAMAPGTSIGAATPVDLGGEDLSAKVRNTSQARLAGLAQLHGRSVAFATAAVRDGAVAFVLGGDELDDPDERGAAAAVPGADPGDVLLLAPEAAVEQGITDLVAAGLPELLGDLDARQVQVADEAGGRELRTLRLDPDAVTVRFHNLGLVQRVLHTVANPTLAYLLLVGGALALLFELFQPGFGVAGVSGVVLFGLGLYGLSVLPVNWLAFALLLLGLAMLAVDLAIAGLGALTAGGALALAVGSFLLFGGPPYLRPSAWVIVSVVAATLVFFVIVMTTVLRAQGGSPLTGPKALVGQVGVVRSMLNPEGHVFVSGALWRARAPDEAGPVRTGTPVRVVGVRDGLTLEVALFDADEPTAQAAAR